jgi:hypothetical protein
MERTDVVNLLTGYDLRGHLDAFCAHPAVNANARLLHVVAIDNVVDVTELVKVRESSIKLDAINGHGINLA